MKFLAAILLFCFLFFSCKDHSEKFFPLKNNTGFYRIVTRGNGVLAAEDQYIVYSLLFVDDKGKVFLDKRQQEQQLKEQIKKDSFSMQNMSPVSELLQILGIGDSAVLKIPLMDEEKRKDMVDSDTLIFYIKIFDIMNEDQVLDFLSRQFKNSHEENKKSDKEYNDTRDLFIKSLGNIENRVLDKVKKITQNGIVYYILQNGKGDFVKRGQKAKFDFIGMTAENKREFDNSYIKTDDVEVITGNKVEIPGWDDALSVMNKGMMAVFFIPAEMAYREKGKPGVVPPNTDLIYLIQLNDILN